MSAPGRRRRGTMGLHLSHRFHRMLVPLDALHVRLRSVFRRAVHIFPLQAFSYAAEVESDLMLWSEERGARHARLQKANQLLPAPQSDVLGYVAGRSGNSPAFLFAHPRWIPVILGERPLPLETANEAPPRLVADLAMEQGCAPDSYAVKTLREDFEHGGISHLALYERGRHRFLTIKRHNGASGNPSGQDGRHFLASGAGLQHEQRGASVRELLPPVDVRLRLIVAIEAPWGAAHPASQVWQEWGTAPPGTLT